MKSVYSLLGDNPTIWVFGYGSLLWKPDFGYKSKKIGYVMDYERRFYQGNVTFRGKPGQPGRVANLVEVKGGKAWGVAYEISGREEVAQVLQSLYNRESTGGGYVTMVTTFYPRDNDKSFTAINRSKNNDHDMKATLSRDQSRNIHKPQSTLDRSDSLDSTMSIDEVSSDDDQTDSENENQITKTVSFNSSVINNKYHLENILSSGDKEVASLINYLHSFSNENLLVKDEPQSKKEKSDTPHTLSSKHHHSEQDDNAVSAVQVLLYTATSDNDLYLGPDDITSMARQIVNASGNAGSNVEYVTKTADFVRKYIPEDQDSHLFSLDAKVREEVYRQQARDSSRLRLGLADLSVDQHDIDQGITAEPIMAS